MRPPTASGRPDGGGKPPPYRGDEGGQKGYDFVKTYEEPRVELIVFSVEDVVTSSSGHGQGGDGNVGGEYYD